MHSLIKFLRHEKPARQYPLSDFKRISHEVQACDVVLVEGRSRVSDVIRWITNSPWTHAAIYIGTLEQIQDNALAAELRACYDGAPDDQLIVESLLGYGTIIRQLNVYEKEHLRICRPARLSPEDALSVVRFAIGEVGKAYDVRQILDLARFLFPWWILPRRWASSLFAINPGPTEKTVCSTMIAEAFAHVNFPILPLLKRSRDGERQLFRRNPKLCTPSDFDYSPYFEIIKYPFVDFHQADYHSLPWQGAEQLTPEEAHFYIDQQIDADATLVDPPDTGH